MCARLAHLLTSMDISEATKKLYFGEATFLSWILKELFLAMVPLAASCLPNGRFAPNKSRLPACSPSQKTLKAFLFLRKWGLPRASPMVRFFGHFFLNVFRINIFFSSATAIPSGFPYVSVLEEISSEFILLSVLSLSLPLSGHQHTTPTRVNAKVRGLNQSCCLLNWRAHACIIIPWGWHLA